MFWWNIKGWSYYSRIQHTIGFANATGCFKPVIEVQISSSAALNFGELR